LIANVKGLKEIYEENDFEALAGTRKELIKDISHHISNIKKKVHDMIEERKIANKISGVREQAFAYDKNVRPYMADIRRHVDKLELAVDNEIWPLPKYRELLFTR